MLMMLVNVTQKITYNVIQVEVNFLQKYPAKHISNVKTPQPHNKKLISQNVKFLEENQLKQTVL